MDDSVASCPPRISRRCSLDSSCMRRSDTPSLHRPGRRCSFSSVSVREHESCLGDNPSCQEGAPISLSWTVTSERSIPLDDFESSRKNQRRDRRELILCPAERRKMLIRNGETLMEILHAERLVALKNGVASIGASLGKNVKSTTKTARKAMVSRAA